MRSRWVGQHRSAAHPCMCAGAIQLLVSNRALQTSFLQQLHTVCLHPELHNMRLWQSAKHACRADLDLLSGAPLALLPCPQYRLEEERQAAGLPAACRATIRHERGREGLMFAACMVATFLCCRTLIISGAGLDRLFTAPACVR
jgi:hypothetical protein